MKTIEEINAQIAALEAERKNSIKNFNGKVLFNEVEKEYMIINHVREDGSVSCYTVSLNGNIWFNYKNDLTNWAPTSLSVMDVCENVLKAFPEDTCYMKANYLIDLFTDKKNYYVLTPEKDLTYKFGEHMISVSCNRMPKECYQPSSFDEFKEEVYRVFKNLEEMVQL